MIVAKLLSFVSLLLLSGQAWSEFNLTIVHIGDFHSHWFEFNEKGTKCSDEESKAGRCFGGFPRLLNLVNDIRKKEKNVVVLSSGEIFLGRSLNSLHAWKIANVLLPKLGLDAMSLSNHDFSSGVFELFTFLYGLKLPLLCANMQARDTSILYSRVNKSTILDIDGKKIGIIGYMHPETLEKSREAAIVKFFDEIPAIKEEVKRLENYGVTKIIALGHSGYYTDQDIAEKVKGVDIVIGGNSDIILEEPYENETEIRSKGNIRGNYIRVHHHEDNIASDSEWKNRSLVLHIPQHGKFVGVIRVTFDEHGRVVHEEGKPVLLDRSIPQDKETLNYLKNGDSLLEEVIRNVSLPDDSEVLAQTDFEFDSRKCRIHECSLGNLVADAMLEAYEENENIQKPSTDLEKRRHVDAVVFNSGSIRYPLPAGNITMKDLVHSIFAGDFMKIVYMNGEEMLKMMEHSVEKFDPTGVTSPGSFLQIAGLRVIYDLSNSPGKRVKNLLTRCQNCDNGYKEVNPGLTYYVAMPEFLSKGGDGYPNFPTVDSKDIGQPEILLIVQYFRKMKFLKPILDGRISFLNELYPKNYDTFTKSKLPTTLSSTSTKKMVDSASIKSSNTKILTTSSTEKLEKEQIGFQTTAKQMFEKDQSAYKTPASEFEKMNTIFETALFEGMENNSTSTITTPDGKQKFNSTTLVTPLSVTKRMESKASHPKIYPVEMEKTYSYVSLMLGQNFDYPTTHTSKEKFLKINHKTSEESNLSEKNLPGTTTETKPAIENVKERNADFSFKGGATEENAENILFQNHVSSSSTIRNSDTVTLAMEDSSPTRKWKVNDTDNKLGISTTLQTFSANDTKSINEYAFSELAGNFIPEDVEVFNPNRNEDKFEDTINLQEARFASSSYSDETSKPKDYSKLYEIKRNFSAFIKNSSLSEIEKVLLNSALEEVNEHNVIIGDGDLDRISNNLKTTMNNFFQDKIVVTTMPTVDEELATVIRDNFKSISPISTQSQSIKERSTTSQSIKEPSTTSQSIKDSTTSLSVKEPGTQSKSIKGPGTQSQSFKELSTTSQSIKEPGTQSKSIKGPGTQSQSIKELSTTSQSIKDFGTEADAGSENRFTEPVTKEFIPTLNKKNNDMRSQINRILNWNLSNAENSTFKNSSQVSDLYKQHAEEIKELLVTSVVNSVLDQIKAKLGSSLSDVNSSDVGNSEDSLRKRSTVKKQLKPEAEKETPIDLGELSTIAKLLNSTASSKTNDENRVKNIQDKHLNKQRMITKVDIKKKSLKSDSKDQPKDYNHKAIDWLPWKFFGF